MLTRPRKVVRAQWEALIFDPCETVTRGVEVSQW
jgi:hypothetical protein